MIATTNILGVESATGEARLLGGPLGWLVSIDVRNDTGTHFDLTLFGDGHEAAQAVLAALEKAGEELRSLLATLPQKAQAAAP